MRSHVVNYPHPPYGRVDIMPGGYRNSCRAPLRPKGGRPRYNLKGLISIMAKHIMTIVVRGTTSKGAIRPLSLSEKVADAKFTAGRATDLVTWPVPVPVYSTGEAAKATRRAYYGDALSAVDNLTDRIANGIARGNSIRVIVESGAALTPARDASDKVVGYANVIAPQTLREVCELAEEVIVHAGAEDPREYVVED